MAMAVDAWMQPLRQPKLCRNMRQLSRSSLIPAPIPGACEAPPHPHCNAARDIIHSNATGSTWQHHAISVLVSVLIAGVVALYIILRRAMNAKRAGTNTWSSKHIADSEEIYALHGPIGHQVIDDSAEAAHAHMFDDASQDVVDEPTPRRCISPAYRTPTRPAAKSPGAACRQSARKSPSGPSRHTRRATRARAVVQMRGRVCFVCNPLPRAASNAYRTR